MNKNSLESPMPYDTGNHHQYLAFRMNDPADSYNISATFPTDAILLWRIITRFEE